MTSVLVVDDKEENRYYLEALLGGHGYAVRSARHGAEALVLARQAPPDVVVSDLLMPVMDGYTLLRHWKADARLQPIPFVVYTATYTEAEDERLAFDLGADDFVLKPAEPEQFLERIEAVRSRPPATGPRPADPARADETDLLKVYSQTLIRKLEEKSLELESANAALQQDIQRRKSAEAALRVSEERFRLLAMATNDAIWDWDVEQDRRWWGAGFTDLFGHQPGAAESNEATWAAFIHPEDRGRVLAELQETLLNADGRWQCDYRFRRADGTWAQVQDRGHVIRDDARIAIRMVGGLSDVSERLALEEQVRKSQRMEAIGQLTGGVAHDFNNLLTVVLGNAEVLAEQLDPEPGKRALAQLIIGAAERGADLTRRLLAFARKQTLSPRAVDLNDLVDNLDPLLRRLLGGQIELGLRQASGLPPAMVDPAQLEHALLNLCINARDAMPDGGVLSIATGTHRTPAGDHYLALDVSDTGVGIAPEHLGLVFEPFFTTKEEGKGTGLGLAMVYGFTRQSGGFITVDSTPGAGTRFRLHLPLAEGTSVPAEPAPAQTAPSTGKARILLVEDDAQVREFALAQLRALGYRVTPAGNGEEALALLDADDGFELLFSDLIMPGLNGRQLATEARRRRPDLKILLTSGYPGRAAAADDGAPVLAKPYRRAELARHVAEALAGPSHTTQRPAAST
ncbi:MAG: response regulator [Pseudomonadales bacterium]|nr:response regulator [Pseudomonadales bacterium]